MLEKVTKLIENEGFNVIGATANDLAFVLFDQHPDVRAVVIGGGVDLESRTLFHEEFTRRNPTIKIIDAHPQTVLADLALALGG